MKVHVTTTLEKEMYELAKSNKIRFAEALAYGINGKLNRTRDDLERAELKTENARLSRAVSVYIDKTKELDDKVILLESELQKVKPSEEVRK